MCFYEYRDSKELFKAIRSSQIGFSEAKNKQSDFFNKLTNIKIGRKSPEQEKITISKNFIILNKEL